MGLHVSLALSPFFTQQLWKWGFRMKIMSGPASLLQWPPAICRRNFKSLRSALKALSALAPAASLVPSFWTPHQHHTHMTTEICLQSPNKSGSSTSSYFCEMFPLPKFPLHPLCPHPSNPARIQLSHSSPSGNQLSAHTVYPSQDVSTLLPVHQLYKAGPGPFCGLVTQCCQNTSFRESTGVRRGLNPWATTYQSSDLKQVQALDSWSVKWG